MAQRERGRNERRAGCWSDKTDSDVRRRHRRFGFGVFGPMNSKKVRTLSLVAAGVLACVMVLALTSCSGGLSANTTNASNDTSSSTPVVIDNTQTFTPSSGTATAMLKVTSGSENEEAAEAIQYTVDASGVAVELHYMGSLDIMNLLESGGGDYDAVWPASSIWVSMGDVNLQEQITSLLSGGDRSSGSSDWLKDMVVRDPDAHPAMVNYESLVAQANKELEQQRHEPLLVVYPADGIAVSDSLFGYVDRG
ncbi:MAG: hypothetical protein SOI23_00610 [Atopobiaceae bacterium]